jgi:hypothetical protein
MMSDLLAHSLNSTALACTAILTCLLDFFVASGKMTRDEVSGILKLATTELAVHQSNVTAKEAMNIIDKLTARFS